MRSTSEGLLVSIFEGFWSIFGPNLGGKIHQKSMSKRMQKLTKVKERPKTENFDFPMVLGGEGGVLSGRADIRPPKEGLFYG